MTFDLKHMSMPELTPDRQVTGHVVPVVQITRLSKRTQIVRTKKGWLTRQTSRLCHLTIDSGLYWSGPCGGGFLHETTKDIGC